MRTSNEPYEVTLAFGDTGLPVRFPRSRTTVIEPRRIDAAADVEATLRQALRRPVAGPGLRSVVRPGQTVAVSVCDATRPQPREPMLKAILAELEGVVRTDDITVLVATGTHRGNTGEEIRAMFGDELARTLRIVNHDARADETLVWRGRYGADVPVWLNREWVEADVRITTGFVEPHFFAGFSGGPKLVAPGLAGLRTVLTLHDARRIGDPSATWGVCEGNPVHDDVRAIAAGTGVDFGFDVILDRSQRVVAAFGGEVLAMHAAARRRVRETAMVPVPRLFDVVVTSNSGYPLDQNLYQAVKGMSAAASVVKPGGVIICAAECRDGFPDHGSFRELLASARSAEELLAQIAGRTETVPDQWQVQIMARILTRASVQVFSPYLDEAALRGTHLLACGDVGDSVSAALAAAGDEASVCVLPEGPQTIAYLDRSSSPVPSG